MHSIDILLTITYSFCAALVCGYFTLRLGLSPIVGYLLAGVCLGPFTAGVEVDSNIAEQLAEIGVILLMFGVGLHFRLSDLMRVRAVALPGALLQCVVATGFGVLVGMSFGWGWQGGLVFGMAIAVASTVVLVRVLSDYKELHTQAGHIAVGWLIVEDVLTVGVLVLLPALFGKEDQSLMSALAFAGLKVVGLCLFSFVVGGRVIPWILTKVDRTNSKEIFTLTVLTIALGLAVTAAEVFGASMALGAFLAGMIVGQSDFSLRAAAEALPLKDAFAVLFFVSVGMLFDPSLIFETPLILAASLFVVFVLNPLVRLLVILGLGYPLRSAILVGVSLAQIGEFSFILATLGRSLGVLPKEAAQAIVITAILSITVNPIFFRLAGPLERWAAKQPRLWRLLNSRTRAQNEDVHLQEVPPPSAYNDRAVVIGYGPVGKTLCRLLSENSIEPVVVELNLQTVQELRDQKRQAIYGDATHRETLESAGIGRARALVLSASALVNAEEIIRIALELNPRIQVLARCGYLRERAALRVAGAKTVVSSEGEVAVAMVEYILRGLGASTEQVQRERLKVRADFFDTERNSS